MQTPLDKYRRKDKKYLLNRLYILKEQDSFCQFFSEKEIAKIDLIKNKGLLSDNEIKNIENLIVEKNATKNLILIEENLIKSLENKIDIINNVFSNEIGIIYYKIYVLKFIKDYIVVDPTIFQRVKRSLKKIEIGEITESLFINEHGDIKSNHELNLEINDLYKKLEFFNSDSVSSSVDCFLKKINDFFAKNINPLDIFDYLYEMNKSLESISLDIENKQKNISHLNEKIKKYETKRISERITHYNIEKSIIEEYFVLSSGQKINKFDRIRKKMEYVNSEINENLFLNSIIN